MYDEGDEIRHDGTHIVIDDPTGKFWEGALVDRSRANVLRAAGVALLPVDPRLFTACAIGGFHKRAWGAGFPLDAHIPRMNAPLTMFLASRLTKIHWCARLIRDTRYPADLSPVGTLRLTIDSGQSWANAGCALSSLKQNTVNLAELGPPDEEGGWVISGESMISVPREGFAGFALYGSAPGLAVVWAAITQTP